MFKHIKARYKIIISCVLIALIAVSGYLMMAGASASSNTSSAASSSSESSATSNNSSSKESKTVDWTKSSETKAYPDLDKYPKAWLDVNIEKQRVYIRDGADHNKILYTMYCSTGKNNSTPRGTYHIQAERGTHFYNASEKEGANYYVSWKNHGEYLFHTVPVDANGNYKKSVADNIGKKASSHGCVQLTIPDAKWVYENVPEGMKVVVH
ncbi:L,D-transpeptidase [Paucilactobacillus suebicus]|uniref:L,D-transpeptidase n=1 Tax=Paucilactobacillus suebicus TaxID=152335 RepID=UPI00024903B0|nr:L,D-transpeptidase [Paucilactobacillus suebicus]